SSRRRHTRWPRDWSSDVCSSDLQPYTPSRSDANAKGDLPLLEAPTIGGNTYAFTVQTIQPQIRANLALLAPAGAVATERKAITEIGRASCRERVESWEGGGA